MSTNDLLCALRRDEHELPRLFDAGELLQLAALLARPDRVGDDFDAAGGAYYLDEGGSE